MSMYIYIIIDMYRHVYTLDLPRVNVYFLLILMLSCAALYALMENSRFHEHDCKP